MTALVLGATGFVGRSLVATLRAHGERVRPASRHRIGDDPTWVAVDLERPETIERALADIDVVYYLVHSLGRPDFRAIDRHCAHNVADIAARQGCRRVVYLGGVAPRGRPSEHLASRLEVGAILRAGAVPAVELRASMIIGNGSASWRIVRDLAVRLPFMVLPRWLETRTCPIALPDVVRALRIAGDMAVDTSAWFDIPGPEVLRARELIEIVAELEGRHIPAVRVPVLTPSLSAMWLRLVSGADYSVARELVVGLTEDLLPQRSLWAATGTSPGWTFRDAAAAALATEPRQSVWASAVERVMHRFGRMERGTT